MQYPDIKNKYILNVKYIGNNTKHARISTLISNLQQELWISRAYRLDHMKIFYTYHLIAGKIHVENKMYNLITCGFSILYHNWFKCAIFVHILYHICAFHPWLLRDCWFQEYHFSAYRDILERLKRDPYSGAKTKFVIELCRLSEALDENVLIFGHYIDQLMESTKWGINCSFSHLSRDLKVRCLYLL